MKPCGILYSLYTNIEPTEWRLSLDFLGPAQIVLYFIFLIDFFNLND